MRHEDRDPAYLWDMLEVSRELVEMNANASRREFLSNRMLLRATERNLEILGEAAKRVSLARMEKTPEIPWRRIIGQRNVLAHEYGDIDHELLYETVRRDIPDLIDTLESLLANK